MSEEFRIPSWVKIEGDRIKQRLHLDSWVSFPSLDGLNSRQPFDETMGDKDGKPLFTVQLWLRDDGCTYAKNKGGWWDLVGSDSVAVRRSEHEKEN